MQKRFPYKPGLICSPIVAGTFGGNRRVNKIGMVWKGPQAKSGPTNKWVNISSLIEQVLKVFSL